MFDSTYNIVIQSGDQHTIFILIDWNMDFVDVN